MNPEVQKRLEAKIGDEEPADVLFYLAETLEEEAQRHRFEGEHKSYASCSNLMRICARAARAALSHYMRYGIAGSREGQ